MSHVPVLIVGAGPTLDWRRHPLRGARREAWAGHHAAVAELYERRLVVRPDGHVCWCADDPPADPAGLLARVIGA